MAGILRYATILICASCFLLAGVMAQTPKQAPSSKGAALDLTKEPTLYVVSYAHLDTEWRWEYPQVIREYLTKTMRDNFALFEKYPHYVFNFSGANRYRMFKEYYPADYQKLKEYVAAGRWFPAGSSMEEGDVNAPNAEAIIRQILYGNNYFRKEFGKASAEYMLPDCFGFPASLPSILSHAGVIGFSTQKLSAAWQPAARVGGPDSPEQTPPGIPFNVGIWEGPDGKTIIAALNPGSYGSTIYSDLSKSNSAPPEARDRNYVWDWPARIDINGKASGLFTDYHYIGTGDTGGSPTENSVKMLNAIVSKSETPIPPPPAPRGQFGQQPPAREPGPQVQVGNGPVKVVSSRADQMFLDIQKSGSTGRLPRYKGDLELINHSAGSLTSQAYQKRWNRKNEILADAAEKASVAAEWLGARPYPLQRLNDAWTLVMGGHFHDIMAGTATPKSYEYAWNDDVIAMNQFAGVLTSATEGIASGMNTQSSGAPIVVYNSLNIPREDVVEARVSFPGGPPNAVRVVGPDGKETPAQLENGKVFFVAKAPSVGYCVYDVQPGEASSAASELSVTESSLENQRYRIKLNEEGDVSSIFDKSLGKELLSAPIRLAFQTEKPHDWPAWNMDWADQQMPPRGFVAGPAKVRIAENGPVRVALEVEREAEGSKFVQTIRLSAGDAGNRVEFSDAIDWRTSEAALKATFPLAASNPEATYNWDIGTIKRANNDDRKFEVASHQWVDLTDKSGSYGVTMLTDCKNGSDKPDDNTLRLTLLYTPGLGEGNGRNYSDQLTQDFGHHEIMYGLSGHAGDWRQGQTDWQAYRLNQPLMAFQSAKHDGALGKSFSLLSINSSRVRVLAVKKAEANDETILRIVEVDGKQTPDVHISFAAPVVTAREVSGQEQPLGPATIKNGELVTEFGPYQPRTFALRLAPTTTKLSAPRSLPVVLPYDRSIATPDGRPALGNFDVQSPGRALPAELMPNEIAFSGIHFHLAPASIGKPNAVVARGQTIELPAGNFNRVYLLAASAGDDQRAAFRVGDLPAELNIEEWTGYIGQWDNRNWVTREVEVPIQRPATAPPLPAGAPTTRIVRRQEFTGVITPGFIKPADLAWFASHRHAPDGSNEPYAYSYLFAYEVALTPGTTTIALPENDRIRILAVTVANVSGSVRPAQPLYDTLEHHEK